MEGVKRRLVVGISGASGAPLAVETLRALRAVGVESHLVVSRSGELTLAQETGMTVKELESLAHTVYYNGDVGAAIASGTFRTMGMLVVPCSMKTAAGICSGYSDSLLLRSADVTLKEGRPLVLCARETPLSPIHLRNLYDLSRLGARVVPPMLTYYTNPRTAEDMTRHTVGKLLDQFGIVWAERTNWTGMAQSEEGGGRT